MGKLLLIFAFLCFLALRGNHASVVSPEDYWKHKLPTTPMPQSIKDSLVPSGEVSTSSLANADGYSLSYKDKASLGNSLDDANQYGGLLSYAKDSTKNSLGDSNQYGGLLSYAKESTKNSLGDSNQYGGLLSYAKDSTKNSLVDSNQYGGLLSYSKDSTKNSLGDFNQYGGLLSYAKASATNSLEDSNQYRGLLSYAKDSTKNLLGDSNQYGGLLSYFKGSAKNSLEETNQYRGYLSYAKDSTKDSLDSTASYEGLLSYAKDSTKSSLSSTNGYIGLLSYAKDSSPIINDKYGDLISYTKVSRKLLANTNEYEGSLSYTKESPSSPTSSMMKDQAFFLEADLHHEKKMNLIFRKGTLQNLFFLPREVANKIPFSADKLSEIYNILSMDPNSQQANVLARRIELCEEPKVENVEKKCVTSLESMVDFVISEIGDNVKALTTNLEKDYPKMEYIIKEVTKISKNDHETVVCHKMGYPYAVYFCHGTATIRAYKVSLVGNDGTRIEAIAACHKETNDVLSKYMVDVLKVVPGSTRICHFPGAEDNIIWVAE